MKQSEDRQKWAARINAKIQGNVRKWEKKHYYNYTQIIRQTFDEGVVDGKPMDFSFVRETYLYAGKSKQGVKKIGFWKRLFGF